MAIKYKAGGNKLSFFMMRLVKVLFVLALIFALLFILAVLGVGLIADFLSLLISAFFSFSHSVSSFVSSLGIDSIIAGYWRPALGLIVAVSVIVKVVFRGYWKLILRPYTVVTTALVYVLLFLTMDDFELFRIPSGILLSTMSFVVDTLSLLGVEFSADAMETIINAALSPYIATAFVYYIVMWVFCRLNVWFTFSSKMKRLLPSEALDECIRTEKEARKKTFSMPMKVKFYVCEDESINAFAFAHNKVAINTGTMNASGMDAELFRGIVGHELGHIAHHDVTANTIANTNFSLLFFVIMIPWAFVSGLGPKNGEKVNGFTYLVWMLFYMLYRLVSRITQSVHYICYLLGGKRCEYSADKFAVKIGEGKGLLRFMAAFRDAPSGGFSDPHPSMENRLQHVLSWMERSHHDAYKSVDIDQVRSHLNLR